MENTGLKIIEAELIDRLTYLKKDELKKVKKAILFAKKVHQTARRLSGEPYFIHPLKTALTLADLKLDSTSIIAAILHDTVEDTEAHYWQIRIQFGKDVANLVESVTKLETIRIKKGWLPLIGINKKKVPEFERQVETLRKMLIAMSKDIRVILIKLADKIHNLETLEYLPKEKQERIAREVIEIYAPIAHRLGMGKWKGHLEDLAFPYVSPEEYKDLKKLAVSEIKEREEYLNILVGKIKKLLSKNKIKAKTDFRAKRWYSLYKKLLKYDNDLSKIYDLTAVRIIVDSVEDCYSTLGLIHSVWRPLVGRIKDYIALPKPNGYKSIHTTVFADDRRIVEIQIRTKEMHLQAEFGVAAHWVYSENKFSRQPNSQEFKWLRDFYKIQKTVNSTDELLQSFRLDLFEDRIFVFTPDGDVRDLPQGATPVDFAYSIHSDIGNRCAMAKVNNKVVPINSKLENGNIVEIITKKNARPHQDWFKAVKTQAARSQIRKAIGNRVVR